MMFWSIYTFLLPKTVDGRLTKKIKRYTLDVSWSQLPIPVQPM
jgi:hypothetical protein